MAYAYDRTNVLYVKMPRSEWGVSVIYDSLQVEL